MVTTFGVFLASIGQIGVPEAVLQRKEVNQLLISRIFWINLGIGVVLTVGFAAAGSLLARFYGDARVARVAISFSVMILLTSASVLHLALLKRAMRFSALFPAINVLARTVSVAVSIILAWAVGILGTRCRRGGAGFGHLHRCFHPVPVGSGLSEEHRRNHVIGVVRCQGERALEFGLFHQEYGQPSGGMEVWREALWGFTRGLMICLLFQQANSYLSFRLL